MPLPSLGQPSSALLRPPTARSLEDENGPGFWRFRELTADTGLYLVARHGEPQASWGASGGGPPEVGRGLSCST